MDRVVTMVQQNSLLQALMRTQSDMAKVQEQITTGKVGDQFQDLAPDVGVLLAAKRAEARTEGFETAAKDLARRLEMQDLHLNTLAAQAQGLRETLTDAVANNSGLSFMERLDGVFRQAVSILNSRLDGRYLYGGTRSDVAPVNVDSLADLLAAPSVADVFENNDIKTAARVDDSQVIEYGVLASEAGQALFQAIRDIAAFNAGPSGPIAGTLTQAQRDFLTGQIQAVITAHEGINLESAKNGLKQNEVDTALERHETSKIVIKSFISDIEDVDLAEAVSRLNRTQVAAQASARVLSEVNQLTLLNFL